METRFCAKRCLLVILLAMPAACSGSRTVYDYAEEGEHRAAVARLVREEGQDINAPDPTTGWTPLQIAVLKGHDKMVATLLELGADPNVVDRNGRTPLDQARAMDHEKIIGYLVAYGAHEGAKELE